MSNAKMVVSDRIRNIMGGIETAGDVTLHNQHRKLKQRFDIVKKLGQGTYGKVQLGINKETGQEVAIKTIRKRKIETEADLIRIRREIQIMSSVRHPNIIHIYEVFENREKMVLVMEFAAGGELYDYLSERKILTEDEARRLFRQIATAVYYCHKHKICHRDLKLENILLDDVGNAKIADFGLSNVFSSSSLLSTFCGSPLYASPEIVRGTPYVGPEVDCWSLGVLLYTLVYGAMPFDGSNFKKLVEQISLADYFEPENPSSASTLIADMLNANPARRANIQSICSHWWTNETYAEICLDVAEELAKRTPVRLDLLLSLPTPAVNCEKLVVDRQIRQAPDNKSALARAKKPVRSQSLHDIPPSVVLSQIVPPLLPDIKALAAVGEDDECKTVPEESRDGETRRKRWRNGCRESDARSAVDENTSAATAAAASSAARTSRDGEANPQTETEHTSTVSDKRSRCATAAEPRPNSMERAKSTETSDVTEKSRSAAETSRSVLAKKMRTLDANADQARQELAKRSSSSSSSSSPPLPPPPPSPPTPVDSERPSDRCVSSDDRFPLTSTVAVNKLAESAFHDPAIAASAQSTNDKSVDANVDKAATLPRRRTCRAQIHSITPKSPNREEKERETKAKCFTLLSTKRKRPDRYAPSAPSDAADSLSSDEDDNLQLLTAENLFSALLSRVRSLTRRIDEDEMRSSNLPRTLLTRNGSLFENFSNWRSTETRTSGLSDDTPSRRTSFVQRIVPKRADLTESCGSGSEHGRIREQISSWSAGRTEGGASKAAALRQPHDRFAPTVVQTSVPHLGHGARTSSDCGSGGGIPFHEAARTRLPATDSRKSEARQKLSDVLARLGRSSPAPPRLNYSRSLPANALQPTRRREAPPAAADEPAAATRAPLQPTTADAAKPPPRRSRFLRPDFFDTPREDSKYVIRNETVRAFRERSLSRQRDLSRNRSHESFASQGTGAGAGAGADADSRSSAVADLGRGRVRTPADSGVSAARRPDQLAGGRSEAAPVDQTRVGGVSSDRDTRGPKTAGCSPAGGYRRARSLLPLADDLLGERRADDGEHGDRGVVGRASRHRRTAGSAAAATCDSASLQNELENEIRKTKTMFSKLNGLMVAMDDAESRCRYGREAGRPRAVTTEAAAATVVGRRRRGDWATSLADTGAGVAAAAAAKEDASFDRLSLLEKKLSYFRRLRDQDRDAENGLVGAEPAGTVAVDTPSPAASLFTTTTTTTTAAAAFENDASSATGRSPADEADSDTWSTVSDGTESYVHDDLNDRIRRRSFYSRFNIYRQHKSAGNAAAAAAAAHCAASAPSSSSSHSRSFSAVARRRQPPSTGGNAAQPQ